MHNDDGVEKTLENKKNFILFVLHEEFFCLKNVVVKVDIVTLKVPIVYWTNDVVENALRNKNYSFSFFCMKNYFVPKDASLKLTP